MQWLKPRCPGPGIDATGEPAGKGIKRGGCGAFSKMAQRDVHQRYFWGQIRGWLYCLLDWRRASFLLWGEPGGVVLGLAVAGFGPEFFRLWLLLEVANDPATRHYLESSFFRRFEVAQQGRG